MSDRQKRRRANARLFAQADGRAWATGDVAKSLKRNEREREQTAQAINRVRRAYALKTGAPFLPSPVPTRNVETQQEWRKRSTQEWHKRITERLTRERATLAESSAMASRVARGKLRDAHRTVRIVETPSRAVATFTPHED